MKKIRWVIYILAIVIIMNFKIDNTVKAAISTNLPVSYKDENFPASYLPYVNAVKARHPNWVIKAVHTGLDWNTVISHESYEVNPDISRVYNGYSSEWKSSTNVTSDGDYVTASKQAVAYVIDPRNLLYDDTIFEFELLSFSENVQTVSAVQSVLAATPMGSDSYKSKYKLYGTWYDLGTTYAELIHSLSKDVGINPVHIASRIRQENSGDIINGKLINGDYGVYNFFNIGAYDTSSASAIENGATYARNNSWTSIPASLLGGITYIYSKYIKWGQNTIYFERFDVNNPGSAQWLLGTGYMTNIFAPINEGKITYNAYKNIGMLENSFEFDIPVYENMPDTPASMPVPDDVYFTEDNTRVYLDDPSDSGVVDEFWIRSGPDTTATILDKVYETADGGDSRTKYTRIGIGQNTLYDKIQYDDGRIGYILKKWIYEYSYTKVDSISLDKTQMDIGVNETQKLNASISPSNATYKDVEYSSSDESVATVSSDGTVLGVGTGTAVITAKTKDQGKIATCTVNVIKKNVESISLNSDTYSVTVGDTITVIPTILPSTAENKEYRVEVEDTNIASVSGVSITGKSKGQTKVTFITNDGNYEASMILNVEEQEINIDFGTLKVDNEIITGIDLNSNTVKDVKEKISSNYNVKFTNSQGNEIDDDAKVGTGTKVKFVNSSNETVKEYVFVVYGDVDGNGVINSRDLLVLQRYLLGKYELSSVQIKAAIIDKTSSTPRAIDLLKIQRYLLGKFDIEQ